MARGGQRPAWTQGTYIWQLVLKLGGDLLLDLAGDGRVTGGVRDTLAFVVLHCEGSFGNESVGYFDRFDVAED